MVDEKRIRESDLFAGAASLIRALKFEREQLGWLGVCVAVYCDKQRADFTCDEQARTWGIIAADHESKLSQSSRLPDFHAAGKNLGKNADCLGRITIKW